MKNSRMTDEWIARALQMNPMRVLENGNLITMPLRLAFANITKPAKRQPNDAPDKKMKFGAALLFPSGAEQQIQTVMIPMYYNVMRGKFPQNFGPDGRPFGLHDPFHRQDDKQNKAGYTPGCLFVNVTSDYKPQVVDGAMNPIVDEARIYSGVWAIVALNAYSYNDPRKKGVGFGLQSLMIIQDDENLGGQGGDPKKDFANVRIDASYNVAAAFGASPPPGTATLPPAHALPPAQPAYAAPPQQQWSPPAQAWTPPTQPAAAAPSQWAPPQPAFVDDGV